jgi:hypothetical protein
MFRVPFCLVFVAALAGDLWGQESPRLPEAPPLSWGNARVEGDNLACVVRTLSYTLKPQTESLVKNGQKVTRTYLVRFTVLRTEWRTVPQKDVRLFLTSTTGPDPTLCLQKLDGAKLSQALKDNPRVLFW